MGFNLRKSTRGIFSKNCRNYGVKNKKLAFFDKNSDLPPNPLDFKLFQTKYSQNVHNSGLFPFNLGKTYLCLLCRMHRGDVGRSSKELTIRLRR